LIFYVAVGHFYLIGLLLLLLTNGRIGNVSTLAHHGIESANLDRSFSKLAQSGNTLSHGLIMERMNILSTALEQRAMTSLFCALFDETKSGYFHSNCQVSRRMLE
jgi:hypothetical protein